MNNILCNAETTIGKLPAKIGTLSICQSSLHWMDSSKNMAN